MMGWYYLGTFEFFRRALNAVFQKINRGGTLVVQSNISAKSKLACKQISPEFIRT
jgi:hypothetical protein